jgi:hypothetical protein
LPKAFQDTIRPPARAQVIDIKFMEPYGLACIPEGALFTPRLDDEVVLRVGLSTYDGYISRKLPVRRRKRRGRRH